MIGIDEIVSVIDSVLPEVAPLIKQVGDNPETGYEEKFACKLQMDFLQSQGFAMKKSVGGLETAFRGDWSNGEAACTVGLLTEYDALPAPLGHACGHQLIMGAGLMAVLATQKLMNKYNISGKIAALGCPGEEQLGGKLRMLEDGTFADVNVALLSHPFFRNGVTKNVLAVSRFDVEFFGQSAHASTAPEQGINALDAMTIFMSGLNAWRQQLPVGAKVHGIITNGGAAANVIPDYTSGFYYVRSKNNEEHKIVERRFNEIAQGAAMVAGCKVKVTRHDNFYSAGKPDTALTEAAEAIMADMDLEVNKNIKEPLSTDFANVCDALPGVNIYFDVTGGKPLALHSLEFKAAAAAPEALRNTCQAAAVMTKLALDYLTNEEFRSRVGLSTTEV